MIQQFVNGRFFDTVIVVQHQDEGFFEVFEIVTQAPCKYRQRWKSFRLQLDQRLGAGLGKGGLDGSHDVTEKRP